MALGVEQEDRGQQQALVQEEQVTEGQGARVGTKGLSPLSRAPGTSNPFLLYAFANSRHFM